MADNKISSMVVGSETNTITSFAVDAAQTDGASGIGETTWQNNDWGQYLGYFNDIPELNAAINAKATWTIGKGFKADPQTEMLLDTIKGNGMDTFNTILENMVRCYYIGGDGFAEIIRDDEGILINLKPLDPASIKIVVGENGMLKRYEQTSKIKGKNPKTIMPDKMFHLPRNRVADQIHGTSVIKAVEKIILARNESIDDYKTVMHNNVTPRWKFKLKTDDQQR